MCTNTNANSKFFVPFLCFASVIWWWIGVFYAHEVFQLSRDPSSVSPHSDVLNCCWVMNTWNEEERSFLLPDRKLGLASFAIQILKSHDWCSQLRPTIYQLESDFTKCQTKVKWIRIIHHQANWVKLLEKPQEQMFPILLWFRLLARRNVDRGLTQSMNYTRSRLNGIVSP